MVIGRGYLGREFEKHGFTVYGREQFEWPSLYLNELDQFGTIINCIGNANTRQCEQVDQWDDVFCLNANLPRRLSDYCRRSGKKFVHISTGCVYDKNNSAQKETDFVASHCRYVVSKLCGEYSCNPKDLILRPRLYFSATPDRNNLLCKLPGFDKHLNELNSYTSTTTIVEATTALLNNSQSGVFNVAQEGFASIEQICSHLEIPSRPIITSEQLQLEQGVALINNTLDTAKLRQFYMPRHLLDELASCWDELKSRS